MSPRQRWNVFKAWPAVALVAVLGCHVSGTQAQALWLTVGDSTLEGMRGGFDAGAGVRVSFGMTREVMLNGNLAVSTSFQIADVSKITASEALRVQHELKAIQLIQNGTSSVFNAPSGASTIGTFIQNTLNEQQIQTRTVIDAQSNGGSMIRALNSGAAINDALRNSIGSR